MKAVAIKMFTVENKERYLVWFFTCLIALLFFAYEYSINMVVLETVQREKSQGQITELASHIGEFEVLALTLRNAVTLEKAYSLGFKDAGNATFVSKALFGRILTLNNEI